MNRIYFAFIGLLSLLLSVFGLSCSEGMDIGDSVGTREEKTPYSDALKKTLESFDELVEVSAPRSDSLLETVAPFAKTKPSAELAEAFYQRWLKWNKLYGPPQDSVQHQVEAYDALVEAGALSPAIQLGGNLCRTFYLKEDYVESFRYGQEGEMFARQTGDSLMLGWMLSSKTNPLRFAGMNDLVQENLEEAIRIAQRNGYHALESGALINLGINFAMVGNTDSARLYQEQGYQLAVEHNLTEQMGLGLLSLAELKRTGGAYKEGIAILEEGLSLTKDAVTPQNIMMHLNMSLAYLNLGEEEKALDEIHYTMIASDSIGFSFGFTRGLGTLAYYHEVKGNYEEALSYLKEYGWASEKTRGAFVGTKIQSLLSREALANEEAKLEAMREEAEMRSRRTRQRIMIIGPLLFFLGVGGFFLFNANARRKRAEQQKEMAEAKLKALQSRMNPHFIYNTINGVQNYILKSEKIDAYNYLNKFSDLLRTVNRSAETLSTALADEVVVLRNYLELEKLRFRDQLSFDILVEKELEDLNPDIPSMMLQPIVENALLHGITDLDRPGRITVSFSRHKEGLVCTIEDNGRGRRAAAEIAGQHPDRHLSIATRTGEERMSFLNRIGYDDASIVITDLMDGEVARGTSVRVFLPFMTPAKS